MEFATHGRSTAAVDGVGPGPGDGRRFSEPPPPHGRDAHSAPANMAALVFRREELLREFHRERVRLDMILCDLAATERAMTTCLAMPATGWGAWCGRPSMHQCEETLYRTPQSSEETSWWLSNSLAPVIPPVYPHVERSPSPVRQQRPVDDLEQQECGSSSGAPGALAVAASACPDAEKCWSQSKEPAVESLVQAAINAVANPMELALFSENVTLESRAAVNQEHGQELKESHVMQLMESGIQRSERPKCPANGEECEAETKNSHAMQLMESELQRSEHPMHAAVGQERKAEAKDSHSMQLKESEVQRSEQLKCASVGQQHEIKANASSDVQLRESKFQKSEQVKRGAVGQENKAEVKDNHEVLMDCEIQRSEQPNGEASGQEHEAEEKERHAEESGIQNSKQPKSAELTIDERIDKLMQLPHQFALAGKQKSPPNEQKRLVVNEPTALITPCGVKTRQIMRINRQNPLEESSCTLGRVNLTCEVDLTQHQEGELHLSNLAVLQSRQGAAGLIAKSTPESSHRPCLLPTSTNDMESEIQISEPPKRSALGQERKAEAKNSHAVQLMENEIQRSEQTKHEAFGEEHKAEKKDNHAVQLMKESGIQSSEQPKPAEPTFRDVIDERRQSPHVLPVKEKSPPNEHKRIVFNETKTQIAPSGVKRPILRPTVTTPPPKRHKPLDEWSCTICQVNLTCEEDVMQHKASELHRSNLAALRATQEASGFDLRNRLRGKSHQESTQTLRTEEGSNEGGKCAVDRSGEDPRKKLMSNRRFPFCKLCKVECTSQKVMEAHLGGRKHRENLLARR